MFTRVLINVTHIIGYSVCIISLACGYFVSISEGEIVKENTRLLKKFLGTVLMVFPMLLMVVEITQIKLAGGLRNHFKSSKNCIDLVGIVFAFGIGSMSMAHDINDLPWMPNLILPSSSTPPRGASRSWTWAWWTGRGHRAVLVRRQVAQRT